MKRRRLKIFFATALCLGAMAAPAFAQINISIDLGLAPPPPRVEVVHEEVRPGYFWIPGFWYWDGHRHMWSKGRWEHERPGYHWVPARWEDHGPRHHYEPGRWVTAHEGPANHGPGNHGQGNAYGHDRGDDRGGDHDRGDWHNDDGGRHGHGRD